MIHRSDRSYKESAYRGDGRNGKPCQPTVTPEQYEAARVRVIAEHPEWPEVRIRVRAIIEAHKAPAVSPAAV